MSHRQGLEDRLWFSDPKQKVSWGLSTLRNPKERIKKIENDRKASITKDPNRPKSSYSTIWLFYLCGGCYISPTSGPCPSAASAVHWGTTLSVEMTDATCSCKICPNSNILKRKCDDMSQMQGELVGWITKISWLENWSIVQNDCIFTLYLSYHSLRYILRYRIMSSFIRTIGTIQYSDRLISTHLSSLVRATRRLRFLAEDQQRGLDGAAQGAGDHHLPLWRTAGLKYGQNL